MNENNEPIWYGGVNLPPQEVKQTEGKVPMYNIFDFSNALKEVSKVRAYGNNKYPNKNSYKDIPDSLLLDATIRHLAADKEHSIDQESGCLHLSHAIVNLLMIVENRSRNVKKA